MEGLNCHNCKLPIEDGTIVAKKLFCPICLIRLGKCQSCKKKTYYDPKGCFNCDFVMISNTCTDCKKSSCNGFLDRGCFTCFDCVESKNTQLKFTELGTNTKARHPKLSKAFLSAVMSLMP